MRQNLIDALLPFDLNQLQLVRVVMDRGLEYGATAEELYAAIIARLEATVADIQPATPLLPVRADAPRPGPLCPECGALLAVSPVNVSKCTNVGGDWRTSLQCSNPACRFTELSAKTLAQWRVSNVL